VSAIFILVIFSVAVAVLFLLLFIGAVRTGQYEDDYSPAVRILFEKGPSSPDITKTPISKNEKSESNE